LGGEKWRAGAQSGNISEKRKDIWRAYRNSPTLFQTVPFPIHTASASGHPFSKIGGSQPQPKSAIAIISGTGKATDCKFGRYIHRVHPNTKPIKNLGEKGASAYSGTAQFLVPLSGMDKAVHIHRIDRNKSPLKILAKAAVAPGHTQGLVTSSVS